MTRLRTLCDIRDYQNGVAEGSNDAESLGECFPDVSNDTNSFTLNAKQSKNISLKYIAATEFNLIFSRRQTCQYVKNFDRFGN